MGRKIIPKEIRDYNYLKDQLIDTLQQKNDAQEALLALQEERISDLTKQVEVLKEKILLMEEKQQLEKELEG